MEEASKSSPNFRVLMLPWLAHGHISPFLQLSKKLISNKNCYIYFCSTKVNLNFVKKSLEEDDESNLFSHSIELVELHLPDFPDLPPQFHTTKNLPPHLLSKLFQAFQMAESSFSSIFNSLLSPDLVIFDGFQSWAPKIASENHIPAVFFVTSGAATMSFLYHHMYSHHSPDSFPFPSIFLRDYVWRKFQAIQESKEAAADDANSPFKCFEWSSEIVLTKSCREIEGKYLDYLSCLCEREMVSVGPLVQESNDDDDHNSDFIKFLSSKSQSSVVFVSFGSECFLSDSEREEIAHGLELSNVDFIWVIRFPVGQKKKIEDSVPKGFLERVKNKGMVVDEWAPQAKILGHKSTGGFLSHCGWSSVMESLYFGVPIIAMPMTFDQPTNARLLEEIGGGMEILRDENGDMNREAIADAIKTVVLEKAGEGIREKAGELREKLRLKGKEEEEEAVKRIWNLCSKFKQDRNLQELEFKKQEQSSSSPVQA